MHEDLSKIIEGLIAQNQRLGQKQIAMECVCSALLAQIALLSPAPDEALDRINNELCGTAMGVASMFRNLGMGAEYDTRSVTATIETVADLSEKVLASKRHPAIVPTWPEATL